MCLRRGENLCGRERGEFNAFFFSSSSEKETKCTGRKTEKERRRERKTRTSERANTRARGGCCCCGRGITSTPLTRKTFRLNLVLDSARLLSTHPNPSEPSSLHDQKDPRIRSPFPPLFPHTLQVLPDRCRTAAEPPALGAVCI